MACEQKTGGLLHSPVTAIKAPAGPHVASEKFIETKIRCPSPILKNLKSFSARVTFQLLVFLVFLWLEAAPVPGCNPQVKTGSASAQLSASVSYAVYPKVLFS